MISQFSNENMIIFIWEKSHIKYVFSFKHEIQYIPTKDTWKAGKNEERKTRGHSCV
jgi:hypothetical protein